MQSRLCMYSMHSLFNKTNCQHIWCESINLTAVCRISNMFSITVINEFLCLQKKCFKVGYIWQVVFHTSIKINQHYSKEQIYVIILNDKFICFAKSIELSTAILTKFQVFLMSVVECQGLPKHYPNDQHFLPRLLHSFQYIHITVKNFLKESIIL